MIDMGRYVEGWDKYDKRQPLILYSWTKMSNFQGRNPSLCAYVHIVFKEVGSRAKMWKNLSTMSFIQIHQPTHSWGNSQNRLKRIKCNLWNFQWCIYKSSQSKLTASTLKWSDFLSITGCKSAPIRNNSN